MQLSLIALFLNSNIDVLIAGPYHSWANPVERIMSIVNLGMQCIGVMRSKVSAEAEACIEKSNTMKQIRENCASIRNEIGKSISPAKELLELWSV